MYCRLSVPLAALLAFAMDFPLLLGPLAGRLPARVFTLVTPTKWHLQACIELVLPSLALSVGLTMPPAPLTVHLVRVGTAMVLSALNLAELQIKTWFGWYPNSHAWLQYLRSPAYSGDELHFMWHFVAQLLPVSGQEGPHEVALFGASFIQGFQCGQKQFTTIKEGVVRING